MYVFGGAKAEGPLADVWKYDVGERLVNNIQGVHVAWLCKCVCKQMYIYRCIGTGMTVCCVCVHAYNGVPMCMVY